MSSWLWFSFSIQGQQDICVQLACSNYSCFQTEKCIQYYKQVLFKTLLTHDSFCLKVFSKSFNEKPNGFASKPAANVYCALFKSSKKTEQEKNESEITHFSSNASIKFCDFCLSRHIRKDGKYQTSRWVNERSTFRLAVPSFCIFSVISTRKKRKKYFTLRLALRKSLDSLPTSMSQLLHDIAFKRRGKNGESELYTRVDDWKCFIISAQDSS